MRYLILLFALFFSVLLVSGCSRVPQAVSYQATSQQKMEAAHHWDVLANDVANEINSQLIRQDYLEDPVFVKHACGEPDNCGDSSATPFDEAFNDLLVTQLVNFGVPTLVEEDEDALTVDYRIQVLYHRQGYLQLPPGSLTALTGAILVFHDAPWKVQTFVTGAVFDALSTMMVVNGQYEVIISPSIKKDNKYLMRKSDIYYINDPDFWHYQPRGSGKEIDLVSYR